MKIIGECGVNWRDISEARLMIDNCKDLGIEYTKFQLYDWSAIKNSPIYNELYDRQLTKSLAKALFMYGESIGQKVFFTPMFLEAVDWCEDIGVEIYKIRYNDRYNIDLINKIIATNKKIIMSIDQHYDPGPYLSEKIRFLFCVPKYPATLLDYYAMNEIKGDVLPLSGVSDHTKTLELFVLMRQSPLEYYEKHIMLDGSHPIEEAWSIEFSKLKKAKI